MRPKIMAFLLVLAVSASAAFFHPVAAAIAAGRKQHWADDTVAALAGAGVIALGDYSREDYDRPIARGEFVNVFMRAFGAENGSGSANYSGVYFADVEEGGAYYASTAKAKEEQLIFGYGDGTFRPDTHIQRQELFAIVDRAMLSRNLYRMEAPGLAGQMFSDGGTIARFAREPIVRLAGAGLINGYGGLIMPEADITFAEAFAVIERFCAMLNEENANGPKDSPAENAAAESKSEAAETTVEPSPVATPAPAQAPKDSPAIKPTPGTTATAPASPSDGGGGGSSNTPANAPPTASDSPNEEDNSSAEKITDLREIFSLLDSVKSIQIAYSQPDYIETLLITDPSNIDRIVEYLRGLSLNDEAEGYFTGGGWILNISYRGGSTARLGLSDHITVTEGKYFQIQDYTNAMSFDPIVGEMVLKQYRQNGNEMVSGVVGNHSSHDGFNLLELKVPGEDALLIDMAGVRHFLDMTGSGYMFLEKGGDEIIVVFAADGSGAIECLITTSHPA
jgi:hypothetical protein